MIEIGKDVPWNAAWSGEERFAIRPCRYAQNMLAMWSPFKPGEGRPLFAKPHHVRQRKSIAELRCTVCGKRTDDANQWWFPRGDFRDGWWMSTEAPVHLKCAELAAHACPVLRKSGQQPIRFPNGWVIQAAVLGGPDVEKDFGVKVNGRRVVGHLKLAWRYPWFLKQQAQRQNEERSDTASLSNETEA